MKIHELGSVLLETKGFAAFEPVTCPILEYDSLHGKVKFKSSASNEMT